MSIDNHPIYGYREHRPEEHANDLYDRIAHWWNNMDYADKNYYVKTYEAEWIPVAALSASAIIRLYFRSIEKLDYQAALKKYHDLFTQ